MLKSVNVKGLLRGLVGGGVLAALSLVSATPALAWWDQAYAYRTRIDVNAQAAGVSGSVARAPVLVRLHQGNFNFADVKADGSDLRFVAGDDRTALKHQVEVWAPDSQQALVWVDVSGLEAGVAAAIYAYYGNEAATASEDAAGTFGHYGLVWHFNDEGAAQDASGHGAHATSGGTARVAGLIGQSLSLDGASAITAPAAAVSAQATSVSLWVKATSDGELINLPGRAVVSISGGQVFVETAAGRSNGAALASDTWAHVALTSEAERTALYVNGQLAGEVTGAAGAVTGDAVFGNGLNAEIDEVRVSNEALPVSLFQLAAASEGQGARLLSFATAEATAGGEHEYFNILFNALTFDAWVVIIILGIMLLIAIWVIVSKVLLVNRVISANDAFLDAYERTGLEAKTNGLAQVNAGNGSTLGRIYETGRDALSRRIGAGRLSAPSVAAIRSALDTTRARESQRLNNHLILLTIAISGGPFIGLAGTVLGVMITFASVAAAGEVNINAIAPGIAAALLATLAGLAVAIPALFGYNYLLSRIEEIEVDNAVFADELEKRVAETWQG